MHAKTQLALLRTLSKQRKGLSKGFTLIELMIVVAVIGLLSALAFPNYLQARAAAAQGAAVGEAIGLGKECATFVASGGIGAVPATAGNSTVTCAVGGGSVATTFVGGGANGINCLGVTSAVGNGTVTVTVASTGALTCAFS